MHQPNSSALSKMDSDELSIIIYYLQIVVQWSTDDIYGVLRNAYSDFFTRKQIARPYAKFRNNIKELM